LEKVGITHILTCASKIQPRFKDDYTYEILPLLDSPDQNIVKWFDKANTFISEALDANKDKSEGDKKNKVLVHCFAGKSRATSFTCGYLMAKK